MSNKKQRLSEMATAINELENSGKRDPFFDKMASNYENIIDGRKMYNKCVEMAKLAKKDGCAEEAKKLMMGANDLRALSKSAFGGV